MQKALAQQLIKIGVGGGLEVLVQDTYITDGPMGLEPQEDLDLTWEENGQTIAGFLFGKPATATNYDFPVFILTTNTHRHTQLENGYHALLHLTVLETMNQHEEFWDCLDLPGILKHYSVK